MTKTPWIRVHDGSKGFYGFSCARCGKAQPLPFSIEIDAWVVLAQSFLQRHKECKENKEHIYDRSN